MCPLLKAHAILCAISFHLAMWRYRKESAAMKYSNECNILLIDEQSIWEQEREIQHRSANAALRSGARRSSCVVMCCWPSMTMYVMVSVEEADDNVSCE